MLRRFYSISMTTRCLPRGLPRPGALLLSSPCTTEVGFPSRGVISSLIRARPVHRVKGVSCRGRGREVWVGSIVEAASSTMPSAPGIAAAHVVIWHTVMPKPTDIGEMVGNVDHQFVRRLGIDEHRFRRVRYVRKSSGKLLRIEPRSIVFTDLDTGMILVVVDGRRGAMVPKWIGRTTLVLGAGGRTT